MFTGIITQLGKVESIKQSHYTFSTNKSFFKKLGRGGSVSINGICLTIDTAPTKQSFSIEVMPETIKKTTIGRLKIGDYVNLELPMSPASLFEGHIVQGHVDGTGIIKKIKLFDNSHLFAMAVKPDLAKYLISKGSVAVNGISLTIIEAASSFFTVGIIPYTFTHTNLQYAQQGELVNIEVDVLAKYVEKLLSYQKEPTK